MDNFFHQGNLYLIPRFPARRGIWLRLGFLFALVSAGVPLNSQGPPRAIPVRYTTARAHSLRQMLTLPGSVEAQTASTIASPVEGLVAEFPAKEGMRVRHGQTLAKLRTTPLELRLAARRAALQEAEARLRRAQSTLARAKELFAAGVISLQQLDEAQAEFHAWQGRAESLKAEINGIEDDIERATVRAPFTGVVARERTQVGQWVAAGGPVVELLGMDTVEIRVEVPERYFPALRAGSSARVTLEALPGYHAQGRVIAVVPQADAQARTFPVKVQLKNERGRLGAGMLAQVSFGVGQTYRATLVPKDAIVSRGEARFIYRVNGSGTVDEVPVQPGAAAAAWIEVRGDVRAGDKVVTRGNERLQPGQAVEATPIEYRLPL